jgi:hypothetical protein
MTFQPAFAAESRFLLFFIVFEFSLVQFSCTTFYLGKKFVTLHKQIHRL